MSVFHRLTRERHSDGILRLSSRWNNIKIILTYTSGERIRLYEENMQLILGSIQAEATESALRLFYGDDQNNWEGKLIHYNYLNTYDRYIQYVR